ncbi:MAG: hypothetical protein RL291_1120, partial [Pseudomonadota bacterium]
GQMALTNYLLQSLIFGWIFYGYGMGLFGRASVSLALAIGVAVFAIQVMFSHFWLSRFVHGPFEWLWRWATHGARPPFKRVAS